MRSILPRRISPAGCGPPSASSASRIEGMGRSHASRPGSDRLRGRAWSDERSATGSSACRMHPTTSGQGRLGAWIAATRSRSSANTRASSRSGRPTGWRAGCRGSSSSAERPSPLAHPRRQRSTPGRLKVRPGSTSPIVRPKRNDRSGVLGEVAGPALRLRSRAATAGLRPLVRSRTPGRLEVHPGRHRRSFEPSGTIARSSRGPSARRATLSFRPRSFRLLGTICQSVSEIVRVTADVRNRSTSSAARPIDGPATRPPSVERDGDEAAEPPASV